jgi:hypothetical protein
MVDIINTDDEIKKTSDDSLKNDVANTLKEEQNVSFEGEKVKFPEAEFANVQEALDYIKKQENLLIQKNREKNSEAVKEVNQIIDVFSEVSNKEKEIDVNGIGVYMQMSLEEIKDLFKRFT